MDSHLPQQIQQAAAEACPGGVAALSIKKHSEVTPMDSIIERQREIVARHICAENEHDWAAVYDTFVQDDRRITTLCRWEQCSRALKAFVDSTRALRLRCQTSRSKCCPSTMFQDARSGRS
jgi:hypothetical protein